MMTLLKLILAVILPPLAVFLHEGIGKHFWINLILLILIVTAPAAIIHAFIRILISD